jgi:phosphoglycolate phosphatase
MRCRAVIFDLDGTLIDSLDDIAAALGGALDDVGLPAVSRELVRGWIGDGARNLCLRAVRGPGNENEDLVEPVLLRFSARYRATPVHHTRLYPGVAELLDQLTAEGRVMGVLTNKPHELTQVITDKLLGVWPFAAIAGHRPGQPLKPDPEAALVLAMELGVEPYECAVVGDSPMDIGCAHGAAMKAIGVTWGLRDRSELVDADALIDNPADLLAVLS